MSISLVVFFEDPWWVGLFTITQDNSSRYCRVVFGQEPLDAELYAFLHRNFFRLKFTDSFLTLQEKTISGNPKRRQRQISKDIRTNWGAKASYEIIKKSIVHSNKKIRQIENNKEKTERDTRKLQSKREKHKSKHRGH